MSRPSGLHPQRQQALLGLLLATLFWGLSFPLIKALVLLQGKLVPESGTWFTTSMAIAPRFLLATLFLIIWQAFRGNLWGITRAEIAQGVAIGLFAAVGMLFQNDGLQFTDASTSAFLTQLYAILIPIYLALRNRRFPGLSVCISGVLVLAGVAILGRFDWHELRFGRGEWETLLSSVFFMGQILWLEKEVFADNRPGKVTLVMFAVETVIFCVLVGASAPSAAAIFAPVRSVPWLAFTLALTVVCTIGAYLLMNIWQPKISATEAGLIYCVEPIFAAIMALFLPAIFSAWAVIEYQNEGGTSSLLIGGGLITLANVLAQLKPVPKWI